MFFSSAVCASEAELRLTTTDGLVIVQGDDVFLLPNAVTRYEPVEPDDGDRPLIRFPQDLISPLGDGRAAQVWVRNDGHPPPSITVDFGHTIAAGDLLLRVRHTKPLNIVAQTGTDPAELHTKLEFPATDIHPHRIDFSRLPFDQPLRYVRLVFITPDGLMAESRARRAEYHASLDRPLHYEEVADKEQTPQINGPGRFGDRAWFLDTLMLRANLDAIDPKQWSRILKRHAPIKSNATESQNKLPVSDIARTVAAHQQARLNEFHELSHERGQTDEVSFAFVDAMSLVTRLDEIPTESIGQPARLALATNEAESIQFVVAAKEHLEGVKISAGPLYGPDGNWIRPEQIECRVIRSVNCIIDPARPQCPDWIQRGTCTLEPGKIQQFLITVKAHKSLPPGIYRGRIGLGAHDPHRTPSRGVLSVPIEVRVWGFALPDRPTLKSVLQHNADPDVMLPHRYSPGWVISPRGTLKADGSFTLNFTEFDRVIADLRGRGLTCFPIAPFDGRHPGASFYERTTGVPNKSLPLNPASGRFDIYMKMVADHAREKGWIDDAYFYIWDEPSEKYYGQIGLLGQHIRKVSPDLKTLVTADPSPALDPAIDIYVPRTRAWLYSTMHHIADAARRRGKTVWWYEAADPCPAPGIMPIGYPPANTRVQFWHNWKYQIPGSLYWAAAWHKNEPFYNGVYGHGDGMLYYPDHGPSVRLVMIRDGIEDYEYFCILDHLTKDQPDHPARKLLSIPTDIIEEVGRYTTDPQSLRDYRRKLAEAIEQLSQ